MSTYYWFQAKQNYKLMTININVKKNKLFSGECGLLVVECTLYSNLK